MATFQDLIGNKCMSNKTFVKPLKQGQKLIIESIEELPNQYGPDCIYGISFKGVNGKIRLNVSNAINLKNKYGNEMSNCFGKPCVITWRDRNVDEKSGIEIILAVDK